MLIKTCVQCGATYKSKAKERMRKGSCNSCKLKSQREKYAMDMEAAGKTVFQFKILLQQGLKKCTKCELVLSLENFSKHGRKGLRSTCKKCDSELYRRYEQNNKNKINKARRERRRNPETGIIFSQRDRQRALFKQKNRYKNQPQTQLIRDWLGCSVSECRIHLESLFKEGMTWNNRGMGAGRWQIDHIIPISLTEIDEKGLIINNELNRKIWHYTNLQPLWHEENAKKSNSYEPTAEIRVAC